MNGCTKIESNLFRCVIYNVLKFQPNQQQEEKERTKKNCVTNTQIDVTPSQQSHLSHWNVLLVVKLRVLRYTNTHSELTQLPDDRMKERNRTLASAEPHNTDFEIPISVTQDTNKKKLVTKITKHTKKK